jgi:hypothetical protein
MNIYEQFWEGILKKTGQTQLQRYQVKNSPEYILKFIAIGGGPRMGTTMETFARFKFKSLQKRSKGADQTGYDHILKVGEKTVYIEQKSSGHWGIDDFKWQHVEKDHKWNILLLSGITYTDIVFWGMTRDVFKRLVSENRITNQGNKAGTSSEGAWFNYSIVKDSLIPITDDIDLMKFASGVVA